MFFDLQTEDLWRGGVARSSTFVVALRAFGGISNASIRIRNRWGQCKTWLRQYLPKVEKIPVSSNAEAARRARSADDAAAIAGESAAHVYGLKIVAGPIEDRPDNTTRFLVIGRELFPPSGHDRTSLLVFVRDQTRRAVQRPESFGSTRCQHESNRITPLA
jgi:hypothetical protein